MPQFELNTPAKAHPFDEFDEFTRGFVEAMFFTNGDTCDDNENALNELGVEALTPEACETIALACFWFQAVNANLLAQAYQSPRDAKTRMRYTPAHAGRDLWFTAQGHGVGFWDRAALGWLVPGSVETLGEALSAQCRYREFCVEIDDAGRIHFR